MRAAALLLGLWGGIAAAQTPVPVDPPAEQQRFIKRAIIDDTLEVTGETVAAKQIETRMAIDVTVNGRGPFRFFVDSGADRSVVSGTLAARLGLPPGPTVRLHSMGATQDIGTALVGSLKIGATEMKDIAAPILPETYIGAQGLVGIDAMAGQRLLMDFEKKTITVQDTRVPERVESRADEIVVVARRRRGQLILTQARAGRFDLSAVIDSGAALTIGNSALRTRVVARRMPLRTIQMVSVTGEVIDADLVILPMLRIGGILMHDVPIAFADVAPFRLFGLDTQPAVLLGTDVMQGFRRVSLDFKSRRIRFVLHRVR